MKLAAPRTGNCCPYFPPAPHLHTTKHTRGRSMLKPHNLSCLHHLATLGHQSNPHWTYPTGRLCRTAVTRSHSQAGHNCRCSLAGELVLHSSPLGSSAWQQSVSHKGGDRNCAAAFRPQQTGGGSRTLQWEVFEKQLPVSCPTRAEMCESPSEGFLRKVTAGAQMPEAV